MIDFVIDGLASYRLTRLIVADTILDAPRQRLIGWASSGSTKARAPKFAELIQCPWCTGMWVSLSVVAARRVAPRAWRPLATALALSASAGLLAGLEKD